MRKSATKPFQEDFKCKATRIKDDSRATASKFTLSFKNGKINAPAVEWSTNAIDSWEGTYSGDGSFTINVVGSGVQYIGVFVRPNSLTGVWKLEGTEENGTFEFILACSWTDLKRIINAQKLVETRLSSKLIPDGEGFDFVSGLPPECAVFIFQTFNVKELCSLSLVCKDWKDITDINTIWKGFYKNHFKNSFLVHKISGQKKSPQILWKEWFKSSVNDDPLVLTDMVVKEGSYPIKGFTRNDNGSRNITRLSPSILHFVSTEDPNILKVTCAAHYGAGHDYNPESAASWTGSVDKVTLAIKYSEVLQTHSGIFEYQGTISHLLIKGSYRWTTNGATGTFELSPSEEDDTL
eukprot:TRINITY_DN4904_c0_g1_i1.p1 TRINITY_DN4904_c0_g1~~TRINITY_DN4904_c0_g1_i1.p1  ORF type:complete len:351 (+),score=52.26 TRINITY_DN4904_c0_g1_i1:141-1193(+)